MNYRNQGSLLSRFLRLGAILFFLPVLPAHAQLEIDIVGGQEAAQPIAVAPFRWVGREANVSDVAEVVGRDLDRTGRFDVISRSRMPATPGAMDAVLFERWQEAGVEALLTGTLEVDRKGALIARCRLYQIFSGKTLAEFAFAGSQNKAQQMAHKIANRVYAELTGEQGVFETRLMYVRVDETRRGRSFNLVVSDWDGGDPSVIQSSSEPLLSPTWHPDGSRVAYVSYENSRAEIYSQDLRTGQRELVSAERGMNNSPAFSPDGRRLAFVRSSGANVDIYIRDLVSDSTQRFTRNRAIDTEPEWTPDGRQLLFTSDRGGSSQVYVMDLVNHTVERLSYNGSSNSRPRVSPDGQQAAIVHAGERGDQIALLALDGTSLEPLTAGRLDDSPSFSPDGKFVVFAAENRVGSRILMTSIDGSSQWALPIKGDAREPVWGPRP